MSIPATLQRNVVRGRVAIDVGLVIAASAIIAIAAQIAIPMPFSPVPMTLQPLAVIMIGAVLGATRGAAAATLYLLEGFAGAPVFAQFHGGPMWLLGPTAGYLLSYPFAAFVAGWVSQREWGNAIARSALGMLAALVVIYAGGWSWLAQFTGARQAFAVGVTPFVIGDLLKIAIGAGLITFFDRPTAR